MASYPPASSEAPPETPATGRRRRTELGPPPSVSWPRFFEAFARAYRQGDHATILGPTRSGKTHLGVELVDLRGYVLFLATKPRDPLISALARRGYRVTPELDVRFDDEGRPVDRRIVYWPVVNERGRQKVPLAELRAKQSAAIERALSYVYRAGGWCVFADETVWLADDLGLRDELTMLLYQGRTLGVSMVCAAQRPAWVPRACYSQADHLFLFRTNDREDLKRLGDIGGNDVDRIRATVPELDEHEFVYYGTRTGVMVRSRVERDRPSRRAPARREQVPPRR